MMPLTFTESDWDAVIDLNLKAVFFLSQGGRRAVHSPGGRRENRAHRLDAQPFQGGIRVPSYTASKSGVLGLTRLLANEWAGEGINVNAAAPGYMAANNTQALREGEERNQAILEPHSRWSLGSAERPAGAGGIVSRLISSLTILADYTLAVDGR
ncbi:SDR family NAD(P)-dependent oxidoreductase [Klebsiella pneumoniae]|nr:SDR family NAD(P)-dependent oxidoreductase [Klebsiella pneumoniae]